MYIGKKLKQLRQSLDLNQSEMALKLAVSQPYYSSIEISKRKATKRLIEKATKEFSLPDDFFEGKDENKKELKYTKKMRGIYEGLNEGVGTFNNQNSFDKTLHAYNTKLLNELPTELKTIPDIASNIYIQCNDFKFVMEFNKILSLVAMIPNDYDGRDDYKLPSFEDYLSEKKAEFSSYLKYKTDLEKVNKSLSFIINVLRNINNDKEILG